MYVPVDMYRCSFLLSLMLILCASFLPSSLAAAQVAVVNKVSGFDHLIFPALFQTKTVSSPPTTAILSRLVNHCSLRAEDDQAMIREAEKFVPADAQDGRASLPPLTFQPEAVPTNGSSILMKFE